MAGLLKKSECIKMQIFNALVMSLEGFFSKWVYQGSETNVYRMLFNEILQLKSTNKHKKTFSNIWEVLKQATVPNKK